MARNLDGTLCTKCRMGFYRQTGERKGGFSGGKAVVGAVVAGPIGLAAGALGKRKVSYTCNHCGYTIEQ